MNIKHIDAIANAVLYEGYMLYPYRPSSVKNRQRFNFGVLYPQAYSEAQDGSVASSMQTELLVEGTSLTKIEVRARFLRLIDRSVHKLTEAARPGVSAPIYKPVSELRVDDKVFTRWQEAIESEVRVPSCELSGLAETPLLWPFEFSAKEETELLRDVTGHLAGQIVRRQEPISGVVEIAAARVGEGVFKVRVSVRNLTAADKAESELGNDAEGVTRDSALMRSLVSTHIVLGAEDGLFVSLFEPQPGLGELAANCQNVGAWPVLVGADGERDTMLASPIILYDYPQIAPESPGDLFDGTEIDEILALRILTMTDAEKSEMRNTDERARQILERTERLPIEELMKLHGTWRELRPCGLQGFDFEKEMP
jgi:hypothetical protein